VKWGDVDASDSARADLSTGGTPAQPLQIFINYRHEDVPFAAMTVYRELRGSFGQQNIFFDQGTLRPGMRFPEEIRSSLTKGSGAFIAMIGSQWAPTMLAHRQRGDLDYVAKELELALQNKWTVIPVLVDNASLPEPLQLPRAIRALPDCQVARLRQTNLDDDIAVLTARLNEIHQATADNASQPAAAGAAMTTQPSASTKQMMRPSAPSRPADPGETTASLKVDDAHYQALNEEADNLVVFLGAEANADDHDGPYREGGAMLPDDNDLADYLAAKIDLPSGHRDLAEVAQYVRMIRGEPNVFRWVKQILGVDSEPGPVHRYLARLPKRREELGLERRYQMIVTPKLDVALEKAFRDEGEPFDIAVYMARGTEYAGRFVHLPWQEAEPRPIVTPNEYTGFPIVTDYGELTRTVIVRISGGIDDAGIGYRWRSNYVITEDHYIDYLSGRPAEEVVPIQILAKLRQASCLFLGYTIADWRLRVFLRWIWQDDRLGTATHWAVERNPDALERQFWRRCGVDLYECRLSDYVRGLDEFLQTPSAR
jgi:SIR2-like domain/TIR domain